MQRLRTLHDDEHDSQQEGQGERRGAERCVSGLGAELLLTRAEKNISVAVTCVAVSLVIYPDGGVEVRWRRFTSGHRRRLL